MKKKSDQMKVIDETISFLKTEISETKKQLPRYKKINKNLLRLKLYLERRIKS